MAKFKKGDRVVNLEVGYDDIPDNAIGTVLENDKCPFVMWEVEGVKFKWAQYEHLLRLAKEPKTATIEIYKSRGQFKFRVKGANGKTLNHLFNSKQGAKKGIAALAKALSNYKVIDLTKK